jgi:hypothetical protein
MQEYEIWTEGYSATGEHSGAILHTVHNPNYEYGNKGTPYKILANSFIEACEKVLGKALDRDPDGKLRLTRDEVPTQDGMIRVPMIWACRCFDDEVEARKSFG